MYCPYVQKGKRRLRILLVDDHTLFREGMRYLLQGLDSSLTIDETDAVNDAIAMLSAQDFDLLLLDLKMPGYDGLDSLHAVKEAADSVPVVVLSGEDSPALIRQAIESGAMGFIPKSSSHDLLMQALKLVLAGGVYLPLNAISENNAQYSIEQPRPKAEPVPVENEFHGLTPRQLEVLHGVVKGKPNKLIARDLNVSEHTVKAHLSAVFRALGAKNRTDAVYQAARMRVVFSDGQLI